MASSKWGLMFFSGIFSELGFVRADFEARMEFLWNLRSNFRAEFLTVLQSGFVGILGNRSG